MDVLTISRRLGHGSPVITLKAYGHLFTNTDAKAAGIMEATFAKVKSVEFWNRPRSTTLAGGSAGGNPVAISPATL